MVVCADTPGAPLADTTLARSAARIILAGHVALRLPGAHVRHHRLLPLLHADQHPDLRRLEQGDGQISPPALLLAFSLVKLTACSTIISS